MTDEERDKLGEMYRLQIELFQHQGEQLAALKVALDSLQHSHNVLAKLMAETAKLAGFTQH